MLWNLPNTLTALRMFAAPLIVLAMMSVQSPVADITAFALFVAASVTDWVDGHVARSWRQQSRLGGVFDPIADKAIILVSLIVLAVHSSQNTVILLPAALIVYREISVSGIRECLGGKAAVLQVTRLAKWKTAFQMISISCLFALGIFEHYLGGGLGMVNLTTADGAGQILLYWCARFCGDGGLVVLWIAALLTIVTGWDYFHKALPHLKEK